MESKIEDMTQAIQQIEQDISLRRLLFDVHDYHKMKEIGIFDDKHRVELLGGVIYYKADYLPEEILETMNENSPIPEMLLSADDYQKMGKAGIFDNKPRVELLDGIIYTMSPITPKHNSHVDKVSRFFTKSCDEILVRTQGSIRINKASEPEPDITILRFQEDFYDDRLPTAKDIHLVIEVAVFTLKTDRVEKKRSYAKAGIPEYWIVIPQNKTVEVFRKPKDGDYMEKSTYEKGDKWTFAAFDLELRGEDLLT
jgi:Uma2 family endonuclease